MGKSLNLFKAMDSTALPAGVYHMAITQFEETISKKGLYMLVAHLTVLEPAAASGKIYKSYHVIGKHAFEPKEDASDEYRAWAVLDDPLADDPDVTTFGRGAASFKTLLEASGYIVGDEGTDLDDVRGQATGNRLTVRIDVEVPTEGPYANRPSNQLSAVYVYQALQAVLDGAEGQSPADMARAAAVQERNRTRAATAGAGAVDVD